MSTFFIVEALREPHAVLLTADDDLDLVTIADAERELKELAGPAVVIDVTSRFVSSRGVRLLVETIERLQVAGVRCSVAGLPPCILARIDLFGGADLPLFETLAEALAWTGSTAE